MKFLLPVGGIEDHRFGILTTPGHMGIPIGIIGGMDWAADNQCFTKGYDHESFARWLAVMWEFRKTCLFAPVPDVVGDARETLARFDEWYLNYGGWPLAFVAQDGQEDLDFPEPSAWETLFVGGTTDWKMGDGAITCIKRAQSLGKRIHIGRVNWWRRYHHFAGMEGSNEWTCDGTRTRFDGTEKTVIAWAEYMAAPRQLHLDLPICDCSRQFDDC